MSLVPIECGELIKPLSQNIAKSNKEKLQKKALNLAWHCRYNLYFYDLENKRKLDISTIIRAA